MATNPAPQFHPNAFNVVPHGNGQWAVIGPFGKIDTILPDEAHARFAAHLLKSSWAAVAGGNQAGSGARPAPPPRPPSPPPVPPGPIFQPTFNPNANQPTWMPPRPAPPVGGGQSPTPPGGVPPGNPPPPPVPPVPPPPPAPGSGLGVIPRPYPLGRFSAQPLGSYGRPLSAHATFVNARTIPPPPPGGGPPPPPRAPGAAGKYGAGVQFLIATQVYDTIKMIIKAIKEFAERVMESNRHLSQYNGQIAIAYTRLSISDFYRNVNLANRTAPSAVNLVKAIDRMRDGFQEFKVLQSNMMNNLATLEARAFGNIGEALSPFVAKLNQALGRDAQADMFQLVADALTLPIVGTLNQIKDILKAMGVKFPDAAKGGPVLGPWDNFADNAMRGRLGGPILPKAGPRPVLGGGPPINFGRGI